MANEQFVLVRRSQIPSREAWQAAIDECGFDLQLDPRMVPFEHSGFAPCQFMGSETGVEIYYNDLAEMPEELRHFAQGRDCCISFRWGGSLSECASAMIASYALAKAFDAIVSYEGQEPNTDLDSLLEQTKEVVAYAEKFPD